MNLNKLFSWEDIWKSKFYIENIKVEYELGNMETKKVN